MNTRQRSRSFMPRACQKCGGDAFYDRGEDPEWRCLQCGKTVRAESQATIEALAASWRPRVSSRDA